MYISTYIYIYIWPCALLFFHSSRDCTFFWGYENQGRFSYPGESMKTDLGFHTLWRQSWHNNNTTSSRHLKVRSFHTFFIHFSYPWRSLGQSCLSGNLTSEFSYPFFLLVFIPGFHTSWKYENPWAVRHEPCDLIIAHGHIYIYIYTLVGVAQ